MAKAKARDGVYERADRPGWWVSYIDAAGNRTRRKTAAHTRGDYSTTMQPQALDCQSSRLVAPAI
jgi:hypothetical protein